MSWRKNRRKPHSTLVAAYSSVIYNRKSTNNNTKVQLVASLLSDFLYFLDYDAVKGSLVEVLHERICLVEDLLEMNWTLAFIKLKRIVHVGIVGINVLWFCLVFSCGLKDRLAHHRWLLFFQFGEGDKSNLQEFKKLKFLLKDEHIQVRVLTHLLLNAIYIPRTSHGFHCY